jgi:hypothetical protein
VLKLGRWVNTRARTHLFDGFFFCSLWKKIKGVKSMQYLVKVGSEKEKKERFQWLEEHGYYNAQNLTDENYPYSVIVVENDRFFGGNATCFAASITAGRKVLSWLEWLRVIKN